MSNEVRQGQSFIDKVIAQTGSWENALQVAIDNGKSITESLDTGVVLKALITNNRVVRKMGLGGATKLAAELEAPLNPVGIGSMVIEINFIVG